MQVPPLRERKDDIPLLAAHFAALAAQKLGIARPPVSRAQCEDLQDYDWPGNIRELQNLIERAVILSRGGPLRLDCIFADRARAKTPPSRDAPAVSEPAEIIAEDERRRRERANILAALKTAKGRIQGPGGAADLLGLRSFAAIAISTAATRSGSCAFRSGSSGKLSMWTIDDPGRMPNRGGRPPPRRVQHHRCRQEPRPVGSG